MRQQISHPGRFVLSLLIPGTLDRGRVREDLLKSPFQNVLDGLPVDAYCLHRHMGASALLRPIRQLEQRPRRRWKPTHS
jgi:hypothetical protein